jgi:hypothetical protein
VPDRSGNDDVPTAAKSDGTWFSRVEARGDQYGFANLSKFGKYSSQAIHMLASA